MAIHGCCYALMIIYFHETHFGGNSKDPAAQPPWLAYWTGKSTSEAAIGFLDKTKMFYSFETVSLGRDDSDNVVVEGSVIMPPQPYQTGKEPVQPEQQSKSQDAEGKDLATRETNQDSIEPIEVEHVPINIQITAKGPMESSDEMITHVLLSMNQEEAALSFDLEVDQTQPTQDDKRIQQLRDHCKTPDSLQQCYQTAPIKQDLEERCVIWATMENNNKFETIFQLRGPKCLEVMRYNFMTMALVQCIDMQMVSLMCHVLNREDEAPKTRMFDTYGSNYLDKKTKLSYLVSQLKDQEYMELLDKENLRTHSTLDEFIKKIVSKLILSKENTLRVEAINQANKMGCQTKSSAALKSPYVQV
ncbi:hypothetical protein PIB30_051113 [Stylosanthes scabra]|uniref:Uncharacterized protein n=1 Tax=Stylosanthes scabra TaxID=79078 RepID=A0ABU6TIQ1_9FABA|nr:hypothetical protein [Stylosanthes scabra]